MGGGGRAASENNPDTKKKSEGEEKYRYGKPVAAEEALEKINPKYNGDPSSPYSNNCVLTSIAFIEARKGYLGEAGPENSDFQKQIYAKEGGVNMEMEKWYEERFGTPRFTRAYEGQTWTASKGVGMKKTGSYGEKLEQRRQAAHEALDNTIKKLGGDGSLYQVVVHWSGTKGGHAIAAEVVKGNVVYFDAQNGLVVNMDKMLGSASLSGKYRPMVSRVDNLKLKDSVRDKIYAH